MLSRRVIYDFWPIKVGATFDFLQGQMPPELSFERSTSGTFVDSGGWVAAAAVNAARLDYSSTAVGSPLGLLLESSATNLIKRSEEMNTGPSWVNAGVSKLSVSQTGSGSPANDSTTNVVTWVNGSFGGQCYLQQTVDVSGSTAYTWTVWLKSLGDNVVNIFSLARNAGNSVVGNYEVSVAFGVGAPTLTGTNTSYSSFSQSSQQFPNGWWRVTVTATTPATAATVAFGFSNKNAVPASGTNGFYAWGFQVEANSFATSYIKSTASQGTRAADLCTLTGSAFSSWYDAAGCTIVAHGQRKTTSNFGRLVSVNDGSANESVDVGASTAGRLLFRKAAADASDKSGASVTANTRFKIAAAYAANDAQLCLNGTLATAETSLALPSVDRLMIGRQGGASPVYLDGHVEYVRCFATRESNARLQELTN